MADSSQQQEQVSEYLTLVERFGPDHPDVKQFVNTHQNNPEIGQWADVVNELHAKGSAAPGLRSVTRAAWAVTAAAVPLLVVAGIYGVVSSVHARGELAAVRTDRDNAVSHSELLAADLEEKNKKLLLLANADQEIEKAKKRENEAVAGRRKAELALEEEQARSGALARERDAAREQTVALKKDLENTQGKLDGVIADLRKSETALREEKVRSTALLKQRDEIATELDTVRKNAKEESEKLLARLAEADAGRKKAETALADEKTRSLALGRERDSAVKSLDTAREQIAALKKDYDRLQVKADEAVADRRKAEMALTDEKNRSVALAKERDVAVKERDIARDQIGALKKDYENRLRNIPERIALVIEASSRLRTLEVPPEAKFASKLAPAKGADTGADSYARSILADYQGDQKLCHTELQRAAGDKNNPWSALAAAELAASDGDPRPFIHFLGDLELKLLEGGGEDPAAAAFLHMQQVVSEQALLRIYARRKDKVGLLKELFTAINKEKEPTRLAVVSALGVLGPEAKSAVPELIPLLKDRNSLMRWHTARTLGEIGPGAREAIEPLRIAANKDDDPAVRAQAVKALRLIEPAR
jgi:hypothetical protein